jgi:hypothetical protein
MDVSADAAVQLAQLQPDDEPGRDEVGQDIALSGDGLTALIAGTGDVWTFTRSANGWQQQGTFLSQPANASPEAEFGSDMALSANGDLAVINAAYDDDGSLGSAYVFERSGDDWIELQKLAVVNTYGSFAQSVAMSADGNTIVLAGTQGGTDDYAAWVFTRANGVWAQTAGPLVPSGQTGAGYAGGTIAVSGDGDTLLLGGPTNQNDYGGAWVYTLSAQGWTEQQALVDSNEPPEDEFGGGVVGLSDGGNSAMVDEDGTAVMFARADGVWEESGAFTGGPRDLPSLSGDGSTLAVGRALYVLTATGWDQTSTVPEPSGADTGFGGAVALSDDGGALLESDVTANEGDGAVWAFDTGIEPVPVVEGPPSISGSATVGQTLTESHATWTQAPNAFEYQWQRCDGTGANCSAIPGATSNLYAPQSADVGGTLRVTETALDAAGASLPAQSAATGVIQPLATSGSPLSGTGAGTGGQLTEGEASGRGGRLTISGPRSLTTLGPSGVLLVRCVGRTSGACSATVSLQAAERVSHRRVVALVDPTGTRRPPSHAIHDLTVASKRIRLAAGHQARVTISLDALGHELLSQFYEVPTKLSVRGAGHEQARSVTFRYRRITSAISDYAAWSCHGTHCVTRFTRFRILGLPPRSSVRLSCSGTACPFATHAARPSSSSIDLLSMLRGAQFAPDSSLIVETDAPDSIGQVATFSFRARHVPLTAVECRVPRATLATPCR